MTNPLKILHIIDSGGLYGAEVMLLNLAAEQMAMGLEPVIGSIGEKHIAEKPIETEAVKKGLKVVKFRMLPGPNLPGMLRVLRYAQKNRFDILHSHGYKGDVALGFLPKSFRKTPLVSTLHGWTSTGGFSKNGVYEWLQRKSLKRIDAVVLVNQGMLSNPRLGKLKGVNFHIVNNGIPLAPPTTRPLDHSTTRPINHLTNQPFDSIDQTIPSFCQGGFTIGAIGRLSTEKGFRYLIEAFSLLSKEIPDARLVIIGEGYERELLESLAAKLKISDKALLPGYRPEARKYLPCFSVFVISSLTEGLPITLLEAMEARVHVVATAVGGIPEVLDRGNCGILVPPGDPLHLADGILSIYRKNAENSDVANKAFDQVLKNYSSKSMAQKYAELYGEVCSRYAIHHSTI